MDILEHVCKIDARLYQKPVFNLMLLSLSSVYPSFKISEVDENNGGIIGKIEGMWVKTWQKKHL